MEKSRLRALVERDMQRATELHAVDFQLITPRGTAYTREEYLQAIQAGELTYLKWEPKEIEVRLFSEIALLRYQADLEMGATQAQASSFTCWHTDSYEMRNGTWQVVWSQATLIR
jgi:hypothetical protein